MNRLLIPKIQYYDFPPFLKNLLRQPEKKKKKEKRKLQNLVMMSINKHINPIFFSRRDQRGYIRSTEITNDSGIFSLDLHASPKTLVRELFDQDVYFWCSVY